MLGKFQHTWKGCLFSVFPAFWYQNKKREKKHIEFSGVRYHNLWPLVAKNLHFSSEIRNLRKKSAPEPDYDIQVLRSGSKRQQKIKISERPHFMILGISNWQHIQFLTRNPNLRSKSTKIYNQERTNRKNYFNNIEITSFIVFCFSFYKTSAGQTCWGKCGGTTPPFFYENSSQFCWGAGGI